MSKRLKKTRANLTSCRSRQWAETQRFKVKTAELQCVQIRHQILHVLLRHLSRESWHHSTPLEDRLRYMVIRGGQAAREVRPFVQAFQPWTFVAVAGIRGVTTLAIDPEDPSAACLLGIKAKLGIGHFFLVLAATCKQENHRHSYQKEYGRFLHQMTIMSLARWFTNTCLASCRCHVS